MQQAKGLPLDRETRLPIPVKKGKGGGSCGRVVFASGMEAGWPQPLAVDGSRQPGAGTADAQSIMEIFSTDMLRPDA